MFPNDKRTDSLHKLKQEDLIMATKSLVKKYFQRPLAIELKKEWKSQGGRNKKKKKKKKKKGKKNENRKKKAR